MSGAAAKGESDGEAARDDALRARILAEPALVLDDPEIMAALLGATETGRKVVDLRGALVSRLEARLDQLSRTHRSVIAAAYENVAGAAQAHRAVLSMLDARDYGEALIALLDEVPEILAVDEARLCLEPAAPRPPAALPGGVADRIAALPEQALEAYAALGPDLAREGVLLRALPREAELVFGAAAGRLRSEAILDLSPWAPAALALGSEDPGRFSPDHAVDLAAFVTAAAARVLARVAPVEG